MSRKPARSETNVVLTDEADIHYWTQRLDVSEYRLWRAVTTVGDELAAVEQFLRDETTRP
jgi:hypothetical protein